ncbi:MAG: TIGR00268 family protein, partial [Planctomycetes bacterium]|nr:TIGR00268 family protein [Planctomycetota bacterium]
GFVEFRVRHHGKVGRIEVKEAEIGKITEESTRKKVTQKFKSIGFQYVTVDLQGFRSGSLNESLTDEEKEKSR